VSRGTSDREIVLALGGGGMRGVAHLGVIDVLVASGYVVRGVAGTSSGALMAALWMSRGVAGAVERIREFARSGLAMDVPDLAEAPAGGLAGAVRTLRRQVATLKLLTSHSVFTQEEFLRRVRFFLPDTALEDARPRLVVVATDSATGEEVRLARGPLPLAVAASSAMPGLLAPLPWDGRRLQDGGAVAEIPVGAARELGAPVIAVEVSEGLPAGDPDRDRAGKAMFRAAAMGWQELRRRLLAEADGVIAPSVNHLHWADYHAIDEAVEAGRAAARAFIEAGRAPEPRR